MKELIDLLVMNVKVDERQARGGAAVLLKAAKDKLGAPEFSRMLGPVPGLEALVSTAPNNSGGLFGSLASLAGGNTALLANIVGGFTRLNLTPDHAKQFVPVIMVYLRGKVGPDVVDRLERTLRT